MQQAPHTPSDQETSQHQIVRGPSPVDSGGVPALFDVWFQSFVTPSVVSVLFVVALIGGALAAVAAVVVGTFAEEPLTRALLVLPAYLIWLLLVRMLLEAVVVLFRIEEHLRALRGRER